MTDFHPREGNGAGGAQHAPGAEDAPPVDFTSLLLEDVADWLGGHVDRDYENVWFPHPFGDGDYAKCRVSQKPGAPYGVDLWVSEGDKQEVLDYIVELLNLSKVTRKLTKKERAAQAADMVERKTKKQAERAYNLAKAKVDHWDGPGVNIYADCTSIVSPTQPVTADGPACVHNYFKGRGVPRPDEGVIRYKPPFIVQYGPSRGHRNGREEMIAPAHIVALTFNAQTGAEEGVHATYIDDEGNGVEHHGRRKRTFASSVGVIKLRTIPGAKRLVAAEGIENALSAMLLPEFADADIWSTSSGFGLQQLAVIDAYDELTIIVDCDEGKGKEASEACAKRWHYARKRVCLLKPTPPQGREIDWDLNDTIRAPGFTPGVGYVIEEFSLRGGDKPSACTLDDFVAYMPAHNYIYKPTSETWPAGSVNARLGPMPLMDEHGQNVLDKDGKQVWVSASAWLDINQPVEQTTWAPGEPQIIHDRLISVGGWFDRPGAACFNQYRPPTIKRGDPAQAGPWLDHVRKVYPNDADHIIKWLAQRVQYPEIKINHALVLGGDFGIGKDSLLEPVKRAVGPWNFREVKPKDLGETFTPFVKAVILRINEAHDLGDVSRYSFYDTTKDYIAAPPDVLTCNEKHLRHYYLPNLMGVILTTNHKEDGIYLPKNDRRHYVAWSELTKDDFTDGYWNALWGFYENGGYEHVAAYLATLDISDFDPKAPPPKTPAFWAIVHANCAPEESELADVIEKMGKPAVLTLRDVIAEALSSCAALYDWLNDRKNRRAIPHRMKSCDYVSIRNDAAQDGLWKVLGKRQVIYGRKELSLAAQLEAAQALIAKKDKEATERGKDPLDAVM